MLGQRQTYGCGMNGFRQRRAWCEKMTVDKAGEKVSATFFCSFHLINKLFLNPSAGSSLSDYLVI